MAKMMETESSDSMAGFKLLFGGIVAFVVIGAIAFLSVFTTIRGNEMGVQETYFGGVSPNPMGPGGYFVNRLTTTVYTYDMGVHTFVMSNTPVSKSGAPNDCEAYLVQGSDNQDMHISSNTRWRFDPKQLIDIHKKCRASLSDQERIVEERIIRPVVMKTIKNHATAMKAIDAYSGEGLIKLQKDIETELCNHTSPDSLAALGIIVDNFVIERIDLDSKYLEELKSRQLAIQQKSRYEAEAQAADALAVKAKATAQADYNTQIVQAERDAAIKSIAAKQAAEQAAIAAEGEGKKMRIAAEAEAARMKIAAEAEASQRTISANAKRTAAEAESAAIIALGKANADAKKLEYSAYSAPGADVFAKIQIANAMGSSFSGIRGYLPSNMTVNVLSERFMDTIENFLGGRAKPPSAPENSAR